MILDKDQTGIFLKYHTLTYNFIKKFDGNDDNCNQFLVMTEKEGLLTLSSF